MKNLKNGKAMYIDDIPNEALKAGSDDLNRPIRHLFNTVYKNSVFPDLWCDGIIVPIHKKNDRLDVNNYRGIIISSCVGKLFLRIINRRIEKFMSNSNKWCINQCGFKPDHRTEDNLFIINTLYNSYVTMRNKPLCVAFIDFMKFFDTIDRSCLQYKMLKYGITGRAYIIKSMYGNSGYRIRVDEYYIISLRFVGDVGVKQGCCLSPTLSNIFQNDMHEIFDNSSCDPVTLGNTSFNSLSWADDLVLVSSTKNGLQTCLNRLENYCKKWGLEVNVNKTKTMVLSNGNMKASFRINQSSIENVDTYEYLGF